MLYLYNKLFVEDSVLFLWTNCWSHFELLSWFSTNASMSKDVIWQGISIIYKLLLFLKHSISYVLESKGCDQKHATIYSFLEPVWLCLSECFHSLILNLLYFFMILLGVEDFFTEGGFIYGCYRSIFMIFSSVNLLSLLWACFIGYLIYHIAFCTSLVLAFDACQVVFY